MSTKKTTILGKAAKELKTSWSVVPGTTQKLNPKHFDKTTIVVCQSKFNKDSLFARVIVGKHYVEITLDITCKAVVNDNLDPSTVRVYQLSHADGTVVTRLNGEVL